MNIRSARQLLLAMLRLLICFVAAVLLLAVGVDELRSYLSDRRGIEDGLDATQPTIVAGRFGTNVALESLTAEQRQVTLREIRAAGFGAVRQHLAWADIEPTMGAYTWTLCDELVAQTHEAGLELIAVVDSAPEWARDEFERTNLHAPPKDPAEYARFVADLAARYRGQILAYQVWDSPNIAPYWGQGEVDPQGYVMLLHEASQAVRRADPQALIIAGGLAPNTESGGRNLSDVQYLREMMRRGAGADFDVLAIQAAGFWSGPDDRRVDEQVLNFSRVILLREEMRRRGESAKPVWALEGGWCVQADAGEGCATGSDTALVQAARLERALLRIQQEWPWMTLVCLQTWQAQPGAEGLALHDATGRPTELMAAWASALAEPRTLYPGRTPWPGPYLEKQTDRLGTLTFWGSSLRLDLERSAGEGELVLAVDTQHRDVRLALGQPDGGAETVLIGSPVALTAHQVRVQGSEAQWPAVRGVRVGRRQTDVMPWLLGQVILLGLALLVYWAIPAVRRVPWRALWQTAKSVYGHLPERLALAVPVILFALMTIVPLGMVRPALLALYALSACLRPKSALALALVTVALAPLHISLMRGSFSLFEVAVWIALGAWLWNALLEPPPGLGRRKARLAWSDWLVAALVVLGLAASLWAEYRHVALREWRTVILDAALLYLLLRVTPKTDRRSAHPLLLIWLSGVGVALYALAVYPTDGGVIAAEGVRRARAFFGSPNNLALYLERLLPLGAALALASGKKWQRWLYGLGTALIGLTIGLTFSRGAWLLGVPAGLFVVALGHGRRLRRVALGLAAAALLALTSLSQTPRFASLFDLQAGTAGLRLRLWDSSLAMLRDHPWLGVGLDNFLYYYGDYIRPGAEVERWLSHPHNIVLDFWLRLGLPGLIWLLVLLGGLARVVQRALAHEADSWRRALWLGLCGGWAAALAHGLIDASFFVPELSAWALVTLAAATELAAKEPQSYTPS